MDDERLETAELHQYRLRARQWLADHVPRTEGGTSSEHVVVERMDDFRMLQQKLFDAGYAGFTLPVEFGGQGLTIDHELVFNEEAADYDMPPTPFKVSINILGVALAQFGNDEQKRAYIPDILSGRKVWTQLLSEPSGGSDLAGLITRATRDGDTFIVNGQKVWSTSAHVADVAFCPVRTRWDVPKHHGISVLIIDLASPGVEIRRVTQIDRGAEFCHEFLTDVVVPESNLVGQENDGWRVARGVLEIEHAWVGRGGAGRLGEEGSPALVSLAHANGQARDGATRRRIVDLHVAHTAQKLLTIRLSNAMDSGKLPPSFGGILKLGDDLLGQRRAELALEIAGASGITWTSSNADGGRWSDLFLNSRQLTIAGGTVEMQRNNISEHTLGLPREPAVDRDIPFSEVAHN